jgi:hypothetical protein
MVKHGLACPCCSPLFQERKLLLSENVCLWYHIVGHKRVVDVMTVFSDGLAYSLLRYDVFGFSLSSFT